MRSLSWLLLGTLMLSATGCGPHSLHKDVAMSTQLPTQKHCFGRYEIELPNFMYMKSGNYSFEHFDIRFGIINEMELLRQVWQDFKDDMQTVLTEADYEKRMKEYMTSGDYRENDIEQLLVYFTFRYIMNAIYDSNIMVYAYLSVMFTMIVRDMNATRFYKNGGSFTIEDQMEVARIFSKEVEHSEENVEAAKEEIIWG